MADRVLRKRGSHDRLKRAAPWAVAETGIAAVASFASALIVARLLDPRDFGIAAVAIAVGALLHTVTTASITQALIRAPSVDGDMIDRSFALLMALTLFNIFVCLAAALLLSRSFDEPALFILVAIQGLDCLLLALAAIPAAVLTRKMRTRALALRTLGYKLGSVILTIALAVAGAGPWALVGGIIFGNLLSVIMLWKGQLRRPRLSLPGARGAELFRTGLWISAEQGIAALTVRGFVIGFGHFHGLTMLGFLNFAIRLVDEIGNLVATTVARVALGFFSAIHRAGDSLGEAMQRGTHAVMLVATPMLLGLVAIAPDLVPLMFGDHWQPAVPAVQLIAMFWVVRMSRLLAPTVLRAVGAQRSLAMNAFIALVATLIAIWVTREAGFAVAVCAYGVRTFVTLPVGLRQISQAAGVSAVDQVAAGLKPLIAAAAMMALLAVMRETVIADLTPLVRLAIMLPIGVVIYGLLIAVIDRREAISFVQWVRAK